MIGGRRRTHNDVPMTISFNAALDPGQFRTGQQLGPASQVKSGLRLVLWEFDGQCRHGVTLQFQFGQGQAGAVAKPRSWIWASMVSPRREILVTRTWPPPKIHCRECIRRLMDGMFEPPNVSCHEFLREPHGRLGRFLSGTLFCVKGRREE